MDWTRNLRRGSRGADVVYVKTRLVDLGFLRAATKDTFGGETQEAVKNFQTANGLEVDGIVGIETWTALFSENEERPTVGIVEIGERFSAEARQKIGAALAQVSDIRRAICLDALQWAVEAEQKPKELRGFYIRGGNLYNKDLTPNIMTAAKLRAYFQKASYAPYYDGGRMEMMLEQAERSGYTIIGSDCSGVIVGLMRKHGIYDAGFDANANTLGSGHTVRTNTPQAGDWACKSGHIGIYVGGGYEVEALGGANGIQLTRNRLAYNFVTGKMQRASKWEYYGDPKRY